MKRLMIVTAFLLFAGITFGQTLKKGCVIGVHHMTNIVFAEGATMDDLIEFNEQKYIPAFEKALPGVKVFSLKGNRGEEEDNIGILFYCESVKVRDQYWPEKDVTSEKANAALEEHLGPVMVEYDKIVKSMSSGHTDWTIL
jgi:hypothetical protein